MNEKSKNLESNKILIVDDEVDICELILLTLHKMGLSGIAAHSLKEAKHQLNKTFFDLILTDLRLPDGDGCQLIEHIQTKNLHTPIAVITAHGTMEIAIDALKKGAFDFLSKPIQIDILRNLLQDALKLQQQENNDHRLNELIGSNPLIIALKEKIQKVSRSQAPIFISGSSGSGKELVARLIHQCGPRKDQPFIPVNCGAIPKELMESELFGHQKGSFTGAIQDKIGLFKAADNGTLFLDEVADLPIDMQVKLLRCLQEKKIRPIGSHQEIPIDVRILSATHKNLNQLVQGGLFREDLFYRINVLELPVPSLKDRISDLEPLVNFLIDKISKRHDSVAPSITAGALQQLSRYPFPGNVRELENILERAFTLCSNNLIDIKDIALNNISEKNSSLEYTSSNLNEYLESIEKQKILEALQDCNGNITQAAKKLGISFRTLRYRLKKLHIIFKDVG